MISVINPKWRGVRLQNEASVIYLNRLLKQGWHLMRLDVDGLEYLGFNVPLEPPAWITPRSVHQQMDALKLPHMPVLVLRKGDRKDFQRAVFMKPDATGHFDISAVTLESGEWGHVSGFHLEDGNRMELFERGDYGARPNVYRLAR